MTRLRVWWGGNPHEEIRTEMNFHACLDVVLFLLKVQCAGKLK